MRRLTPPLVLVLALAVAGCGRSADQGARAVPGGDAQQGARLIAELGCGTCHAIPGIRNARGLVGPPLDNIADRVMIAGVLSNTPDNMTIWLEAPQSVVPGNAMPNMGLDSHNARNVAAYLYTLR